MYNDNLVPKKVKKEYLLKDIGGLVRPVSDPSEFRPQVVEGGYSSKKLYRCGSVWYLSEYFDMHDEPFRFKYGPKGFRDGLSEKVRAAIQKAELMNVTAAPGYENEEPVLQEIIENPFNPPGYEYQDVDGNFVDIETAVEYFRNISDIPGLETLERREWTEEEKQEKRRINRAHAKQNLRMLCNLNKLHYMYTFTFAPELHENVKGLRFILPLEEQCDRHEIERAWNKRRSAIARWCRKNGYDFKYVKVLEKHLGNKAEEESVKVGTYHIHLATDKPIDKHVLQKLWGFGVVWIDDFNKPRKKGSQGRNDPGREQAVVDPGVYMSKYMEKDFDDAELHGYRAYSPSKNLKRPRPDRDEYEVEQLLQKSHAEDYTVFDVTFDIEYSIHRRNCEPEKVQLRKRYRIFNFRRQPQYRCLRPDDAGVLGECLPP